MRVVFMSDAWEDYLFWQQYDTSILKKINTVIKESMLTPLEGSGKPEALKENLKGFWLRRIHLEHRLVYRMEMDAIYILQRRYHY